MVDQQLQVVNCTFATKLSTGNYENEEYRLSVTATYDPTLTQDELMLEAEELGRKVRSQAYTEAGVDWSTDDNGRVMRLLKSSVPKSGSGPPSAKPQANKPDPKPVARKAAPASKSRRVNADAAALWVHLTEIEEPKSEYFDNRDRIESGAWKPTAPYFKHKKSETKLFLSDCPPEILAWFIDDQHAITYDYVGSFAN